MTAAPADYRPPWWLRGRHLQSLWGPLRRRPRRPAFRRERWDTPDGDFLDLDWLAASPARVMTRSISGGPHWKELLA